MIVVLGFFFTNKPLKNTGKDHKPSKGVELRELNTPVADEKWNPISKQEILH